MKQINPTKQNQMPDQMIWRPTQHFLADQCIYCYKLAYLSFSFILCLYLSCSLFLSLRLSLSLSIYIYIYIYISKKTDINLMVCKNKNIKKKIFRGCIYV